ncbi:SMI1/KNR4 family protein [Listeria booriae]|uniref:SMI1/KNR4 family protein n=1 Tax=Listeria booriae TaxID=1552123 RepID=UPI001623452B|nr:SMI1/KNR4 family protein [Listeria booriae]MBC1523073.1 SMI1/KNR4 family protein [Listeria booriae]MBC1528972.1 SMI1/KNR4 family protein [Listeria booriae]
MGVWLRGRKPASEHSIVAWEQEHELVLPTLYKELLSVHDGGLLAKNHFSVSEPTSYGLADAEIYTLAGLAELQMAIPQEDDVDLPGRQVYFHRDGDRYIGLDYQTDAPRVIYVDFETLQTLVVAESFTAFIDSLYFSPFPVASVPRYPLVKVEQMLALANVAKTLQILELLEDCEDKSWYLARVDGLLHSEESPYQQIGVTLLENQIFYFRRKLNESRITAMLEWLELQHIWPEKVAELRKEWED